MPLDKSKTKKAFKHNVSEMVAAGHPLKQALAAAYAVAGEKKKRTVSPEMPAHMPEQHPYTSTGPAGAGRGVGMTPPASSISAVSGEMHKPGPHAYFPYGKAKPF